MKLAAIALFAIVLAGAAPASKPSSRPGGEIVPPARRDVPGKRVTLTSGELYRPEFFISQNFDDVLIWFHGAPWCAQQTFYDANKNAVLLVVDPKLWKDGVDAKKFDAMLDEVSKSIEKPLGKICVGSFSAGYSAVRDILSDAKMRDRVSDVVLADSLYPPRVKGKENELDAEAMKPWVEFAKLAKEGTKTFVFSQLFPPEEKYRGNTTSLAASYLLNALKVERVKCDEKNSRGVRILYRAESGNFHVLGYAGMTNQDHFEHFYGMSDLLRMTSLEDAP